MLLILFIADCYFTIRIWLYIHRYTRSSSWALAECVHKALFTPPKRPKLSQVAKPERAHSSELGLPDPSASLGGCLQVSFYLRGISSFAQ